MKRISMDEFLSNEDDYQLITSPKPVGWWRIGADPAGMKGTHIPIYTMPTKKQIENHYKMLGWEFVEKYI